MNDLNPHLEDVLAKAATEPAHRPQFFALLMAASVVVPGVSTLPEQAIDAATPVDLQHWEKEDGSDIIPFFTSVDALKRAVSAEQAYLVMPVRTLFAMTLGETLFLNPKLANGKEFTPREITHLLDEGSSALSQQTVREGGTALLLSTVVEPPPQMIDSLIQLFAGDKSVRHAWLAQIKEAADQPANLLIGIEADGDIGTIIQAAGGVASDTLPGDEPIDICQVVEGEQGISHFFSAHITPFYQRRWGSFLRDFKVKNIS